jgi:hypothetical protein
MRSVEICTHEVIREAPYRSRMNVCRLFCGSRSNMITIGDYVHVYADKNTELAATASTLIGNLSRYKNISCSDIHVLRTHLCTQQLRSIHVSELFNEWYVPEGQQKLILEFPGAVREGRYVSL